MRSNISPAVQDLPVMRNTDFGIRSEGLLTFETPLFRYKAVDPKLY